MRLVLALTACDRPHYLARTLASWDRARGIADVPAVIRCEPGNSEVMAMCRDALGGRATVRGNARRLGEAANQWRAVEDGFAAGADFVVLAEDDNDVAADVLEYFTWAAAHFEGRPEVLTACTFRHRRVPGGLAGVTLDDWFQCNVWGIWRDRWENLVRDDWREGYMADGWDTRISRHWVQALGFRCATPSESRSQNFGAHGGAHGDGPRAQSDCWDPDIAPQDYREVS